MQAGKVGEFGMEGRRVKCGKHRKDPGLHFPKISNAGQLFSGKNARKST